MKPVLGLQVVEGAVRFGAFAPRARRCAVRRFELRSGDGAEGQGASGAVARADEPMEPVGEGFFEARIACAAGTLYKFVVDDRELPDPYARYLPYGVHGPAAVFEPAYAFRHPNIALPLSDQVLYELHVGTFTPEGTYDAARRRLGYLAELGVRTIELMPISAFPGGRGWGYDGVAHYAPFAPYGTPDDLRRFIDEAHGQGLSMILDVVYNHFGPDGNYLGAYAPEYFASGQGSRAGSTDLRPPVETPWGDRPNFASPAMRRYVIDNAAYWLHDFRFDGLRLDAIQAIDDASDQHVLRELLACARALGKHLLFAEDDRNDPRTISCLGFDGVWADDFHHQVRVTLTGERDGYYGSYTPGPRGIAEAINRGWIYEGQPYPTTGRPRGRSAANLLAESFVYCIQNHDQVGNRAFGDRLSASISADAYRAASMLLLFLPMTPLLFMGQEWAASTPFLYFTDHAAALGASVADGRRQEFAAFSAFSAATVPDPQDPETFARSKLRWEECRGGAHASVLALYRELLYLRRSDPVLRGASRKGLRADVQGETLVVRRRLGSDVRMLCVNFGETAVDVARLELEAVEPLPVLASSGEDPCGALPPHQALILAGRAARDGF